MNSKTAPEIVDAQVTNSANEPDPDFWGPLIYVVRFGALLIEIHFLIAALLFPRLLTGNDKQGTPALFYQIWYKCLGLLILVLNILAVLAIADLLTTPFLPLFKLIHDSFTANNWTDFTGSARLLLSQVNLIPFAKSVFVFIAWTVSLAALTVVNHEKSISALFFAVEDEATHTRDESVMLIRAGQAALRSLNTKVWGEETPGQMVSASDLIRSIGPLALLFLNKERNILRWGLVGAKAATKGIKFFQNFLQQK